MNRLTLEGPPSILETEVCTHPSEEHAESKIEIQ